MMLAWLLVVGWLAAARLAAACNLQPVCLRLAAETARSQYTPKVSALLTAADCVCVLVPVLRCPTQYYINFYF
jgi:hypothetical protein